MARRRIDEAAAAMGGRVISASRTDGWFEGISIDSRSLEPGQLFFALEGEQTDGHRFIQGALANGAAGAVIHREPEHPENSEAALILVDDTYAGFHALTRWLRQQIPGRLVGITGSAGKTTTKELLARILARRYRTAKSPGNLNNLFGFPLALSGIADDCEWMVAELGMSQPGELGQISQLARPDVAMIINVHPAHLENFSSLEAIADAKAEILQGLREGGTLIANADDPQVARIAGEYPGPVLWFGTGEGAKIRALDIGPRKNGTGSRFLLEVPGSSGDRDQIEVEIPLLGKHNVENALAAAACAVHLEIPLSEIAAALEGAEPTEGRGHLHRMAGETLLIDDSYNSNPSALNSALESAASLADGEGSQRRWAVLGDMLELGEGASAFHSEAGKQAVEAGFQPIACVGPLSRDMAAAVAEAGGRSRWFATAEEAADWAERMLEPGDLVLIKGSRGIGLEAVTRRLVSKSRRSES